MAYRQEGIAAKNLHHAPVYVSYNSNTYDPNGTPTPRDADSNTMRLENPVDPGNYLYYDYSLALYASSNMGTTFCYSTNFVDRADPLPPITSANWNDNISLDNPYNCYPIKIGPHDVYANHTNVDDALSIAEHVGLLSQYNFSLADNAVSAGLFQLGAHFMWQYTGPTWFSSSIPGGGMLHVPISDPSPARTADLEAKLAVCQFAVATDTPIRNAGFTPLYSTLGTAKDYFEGNLTDPAFGGPQASPIQYECQKNFIVLVTDGLPTEDPDGNGDLITPVANAATALRSTTVTLSGSPVNFDIQTFVLGFALPQGLDGALDPVAVAGGTDVAGEAYYAGNESELAGALDDLFLEILNRTSSGTAASVIAASREGDGAVFQAIFEPHKTDGVNKVAWAGDVHALFVDSHGYMRESVPEADGTQILNDTATDKIITMCYDDDDKVVLINKSADTGNVPDSSAAALCSSTDFPEFVNDIKYLWSAGEWLAELADTTTQRSYASPSSGRHILTAIDANGDGLIHESEAVPFQEGRFTDTLAGLLQASDAAEADAIVNYIRGADQSYRGRQIDYDGDGTDETWRLGDVVYSTPTPVGAPAEDFDLLYRDSSYADFSKAYKDRRQMVYVGANDGMLHAFNAGWYDKYNKKFYKGKPADGVDPAAIQFDLGAELWAYVPYNLLAHLKYLTRADYGSTGGDHIYYVDLKPRIFDAQIFFENDGTTPLANHPEGWGTVLVGGMRFGGGEITVDADTTDDGDPLTTADVDQRTLRSAYFILDITNPEEAPRVLFEFTHPDLGYTTASPTPLKVGDDWYLMLGSGPHPANAESLAAAKSTQNGKLFLIDLKTMGLVTGFGNIPSPSDGIWELADANSFVSDLVAVDYDLDYNTDALYFGTVSGTAAPWSGNMQRVRIQDQGGATPTYLTVDNWAASILYNTGQPVTSAPTIGIDSDGNRWVFTGTGRFFVRDDADDSSQQSLYAVKEPYSIDGNGDVSFTWTAFDPLSPPPLSNVSNVTLYENYSVSYNDFNTIFNDIKTKSGWYINFPTSKERNLGQAALLGEILTFTTYIPSSAVCTFEGTTNLSALYYGTGTAYIESVVGTNAVDDGGVTRNELLKSVTLGVGMSTTASLHTGQHEGAKAYVQTSTGAILAVEQINPGMVKSGTISWGER